MNPTDKINISLNLELWEAKKLAQALQSYYAMNESKLKQTEFGILYSSFNAVRNTLNNLGIEVGILSKYIERIK